MTHPWTEIVTAVGTALGAIFTALGLGFIVVQLRAARRQLTITTFEHLYSGMQDIHKVLIEKPYLRPFFYGGKATKEGSDHYEEVCVAAEMLADFFQQVCLELEFMPPKTAQGWKAYISNIIGKSPALRSHLRSNAAWYPSQLLVIAEEEPLAALNKTAQPTSQKSSEAETGDV